ncbi:hypothetical protein [Streptomyces griseus]|uniref:hypothetical protein n=1 Tax=Streptomyces griseus TaxID=1911 RepID=UPI000564B820|nr:hypothetical protein [Streptomyces griseus]
MDRDTGATGPSDTGDEPEISRPELRRRARALRDAAREAERYQEGDPAVFAATMDAAMSALRGLVELVTGKAPEEPTVMPARSGAGRRDPAETLRRVIELAEDLLARDFTDEDLKKAFAVTRPARPAVDGTPLPGERAVSVVIDVSSYVVLDFTDPEAVARKTLSEATRNSASGTKMAVSALQYALGASPLKLFADTTKLLGEAVRARNAEALKANMAWLADVEEREQRLAELWDDLSGPEPDTAPDRPHDRLAGASEEPGVSAEPPDALPTRPRSRRRRTVCRPRAAEPDVVPDDDGPTVEHPRAEEPPTPDIDLSDAPESPADRGLPGL